MYYEPLRPRDATASRRTGHGESDVFAINDFLGACDEAINRSPAISLAVIVRHVLADSFTQMRFPEWRNALQAFLLGRPHESLGVGVLIRALRGQANRRHTPGFRQWRRTRPSGAVGQPRPTEDW